MDRVGLLGRQGHSRAQQPSGNDARVLHYEKEGDKMITERVFEN
jgi:hypothetical protein